MPDPRHVALLTLRQQRLVVLEQYRVLAEPKLFNKRFDMVPHRDRIASDRRQDVVLANQVVTHQVADPIVIAAHAMNRAFGVLPSAQRAKIFPGRSRKFVQQKKLVVLEFGTLPDFEQMRGDRKISFARRLTKLQNHHDSARGECDGRDHRRDSGSNLPIYQRHSVATLATAKPKRNADDRLALQGPLKQPLDFGTITQPENQAVPSFRTLAAQSLLRLSFYMPEGTTLMARNCFVLDGARASCDSCR